MATRRGVIAGLLAAGLLPGASWAEAGSPAYLSAARDKAGRFVLVGLGADLSERFRLPLPSRGHAAAAHPTAPHAVAFARRPGVYALVLDCRTGAVLHQLDAREGRHFYGHGTFSPDGALLFTTENDYDAARGVIGVWDVTAGYRRVGEFASGGIGPHDMRLSPGGALVVANGGIETHPDSGRTKLNLATMRSNLTYLTMTGEVLDQIETPEDQQRNSIRHLAVDATGQVAFAMQWQGEQTATPPLLGLHRRGEALRLISAEPAQQRQMQGYAGSIAFGANGRVAITSPRGGVMQVFDSMSGGLVEVVAQTDICGVAQNRQKDDLVFTTGAGVSGEMGGDRKLHQGLQFDNHLIAI